jgi:hypothetical protein
LGRNFELKRKDYLHEEVMKGLNKEIKLKNILRAFESMAEVLDNTQNEGKALIGTLYSSQFIDTDLGLPELWQSIKENQQVLQSYSAKINHQELNILANGLGNHDRDLKSDIANIILYLKSLPNT